MTSKWVVIIKIRRNLQKMLSWISNPLAIIKGKIDLLLQENTLKEEAMTLLISIEEATSRLSRIKSLLLLSKIENQQYENRYCTSFTWKVKALNEDFILDKNIELVDEAIAELDFKINSEIVFYFN
jgi:signal transduction histidine kinase